MRVRERKTERNGVISSFGQPGGTVMCLWECQLQINVRLDWVSAAVRDDGPGWRRSQTGRRT